MSREEDDKYTKKALSLAIVNNLGINLCSVEGIDIDRQDDGQIKEIVIKFIPA